MRGLGAAAVWARAVPAGIMASSNGRPMLTPTPLMTVLRERCFFVMNMGYFLYGASTPISLRGPCPDISTGPLPRTLQRDRAPRDPLRVAARCARRMKNNPQQSSWVIPCSLRLRLDILRHASHLELIAVDDSHHDGLEPVIVLRAVVDDLADRRHIAVFHGAAQRVGHQLLGQGLHELERIGHQGIAQVGRAVDLAAVG